MAVFLPNGITIAIATAYDTVRTVTAVTNANPAVATTSVAHGVTTGDIIEVTSGWSRLNNQVVRAAAASGSVLSYEGVNATSTAAYPAGSGIGSIRKVNTFTQVTQVINTSTSGGEMQFATFSFLEQDFETQIPTQASPVTLTLTIADDPALAGYQALKNAAATRSLTALRFTLPNGSIILNNAIVSFVEIPTFNKGEPMSVTATFSLQGLPVRYA